MNTIARRFALGLTTFQKYFLIGGVPLALCLILTVTHVGERYRLWQQLEMLNRTVTATAAVTELVHELQAERGTSAVFVRSGGLVFADIIDERRSAVDSALSDVRQAFEGLSKDNVLARAFAAIDADLARLPEVRRSVDRLEATPAEILTYYSALNTALINAFVDSAVLAPDGGLASRIDAIGLFLMAKDLAGQERAVMSAAFAAGGFADGGRDTFARIRHTGDATLDRFAQLDDPVFAGVLDTILSDPATGRVEALRKAAENGDFTSSSGTDVFDAHTAKLVAFRDAELALLDYVSKIAREMSAVAKMAVWTTILTMVIVLALVSVAMLVLARSERSVMREVVDAAERMSKGELDAKLPAAGTNGLSRMIRTLAVFRDAMASAREADARHMMEERDKVEAMKRRAVETRERSSRIADDLERTAASAEELSSSVRSAVASTQSADAFAAEMREKAGKGTRVVHSAIDAMGRISAASDKIGSITKIIDEIAFQTNLLALNARVEAARAGVAGRGFAVVASEVQQLAGRSARAAADISTLIEEASKEVTAGAEIVQHSGRTLDEIAEGATEIAGLIQLLASMSREQAATIDQISTSTSRLDDEMRRLSSAMVNG